MEYLSKLLDNNLLLGLFISLVAGLLTSLTPCTITSVALIVGYVGGNTIDKKRHFTIHYFV